MLLVSALPRHARRASPLACCGGAVLLLLVAIALGARSSHARFLTDREIENEVCTSSAYQIVSRATVDAPPMNPVDVIFVNGAQTTYSLDCIQVVESPTYDNPLLSADQKKTCADSQATMMWCQSDASLTEPQWSCKALLAYQKEPKTQTIYNAPAGKKLLFKVQWRTDQRSPLCFPRDITVIMVGHTVTEPGTQVGASVAFILIVLAVGILVLAFGAYMLRKITRKFSKRDEAVIASNVGLGPYEAAVAAMGVTSPNGTKSGARTVDFYSDDVDMGGAARAPAMAASDDQQQHVEIAITDTNEVLQSQPMPKPWYKRAEYDGNQAAMATAAGGNRSPESLNQTVGGASSYGGASAGLARKQLQFGSQSPVDQARGMTPNGGAANLRNRRGPSLSAVPVNPRMYDDDGKYHRPNTSSSQRAPLAGDVDSDVDYGYDNTGGGYNEVDEEDDVVLTCTDCMLPIRDVETPQYCAVTGKRHY